MIARLLALLAALALIFSPLNAAAAADACAHMEQTPAAAESANAASAMADMPCCDPDPSAPMDSGCAAACVAMAGAVADLPQAVAAESRAQAWARYVPAATRVLRDHPPSRLERPPRTGA
jgi:hypothetical protein